MSALLLRSAWASVFTEMNSTPSRCSAIMRLTALPPPPPTPTTFIRAFWVTDSSSSKMLMALPLCEKPLKRTSVQAYKRFSNSRLLRLYVSTFVRLEKLRKPPPDRPRQPVDRQARAAGLRRPLHHLHHPVERQSGRGAEARLLDVIDQAAGELLAGLADAHRH